MKPIWFAVAIALLAAAGLAIALVMFIPSPASPVPAEAVRTAFGAPEPEAPSRASRAPPARSEVSSAKIPPPPSPFAAPVAEEEAKLLQWRDEVHQNLSAEYEHARRVISAKCFPKGGAPQTTFTYQATINAEGREVARGVSESREGSLSEDARRCLSENAFPMMKVEPPGRPVTVDVVVTWP